MAGPRHALTQRSKSQRSRSHGHVNRHGRTVASDACCCLSVCCRRGSACRYDCLCFLVLAAASCKRTYRCIVDATGSVSATDTAEEVDQSGLTTFIALVLSRSWLAVVTTAGAHITVDIMKTSPSSAWMIPFLLRASLQLYQVF